MKRAKCMCGCGVWAQARHHAIYAQHCRRAGASIRDQRNLVPVARTCHDAHHNRTRTFSLASLPTSVYEFAAETLGPGAAYCYLRRYYADEDPRLDALLHERTTA